MTDRGGEERSLARRRSLEFWFLAASAAAAIVIAVILYRPHQGRPFSIIDFAEFIPPLERNSTWLQQTTGLAEYYTTQGRFAVVAYALLAAKWSVLGWWSQGWQLARAGLMLLLVALSYHLLRRLGASRLGGLVGASLFVWAPAASDGWVRLNMSEPLGAALAFAASIRAIRFQSARHWGRESALLGVVGITLIWTKELLAPLLLLPVVLALTRQPDGSFASPRWERRNVVLLLTVALTAAAALVPVALVYLRADDSAYASLYGQTMLSPTGLLAIWVTSFIPFDPVPSPANAVWILAFVGLIILLAAGWRFGFTDPREMRRARWLFVIALLVPLVGILVYLPSPWYARFYSLPYLMGAAILLGVAATYLEGTRSGRFWVLSSWAAMALHACLSAATLASRADAVQRRDSDIISFVSGSVVTDSLLFATDLLLPTKWREEGSSKSAPRSLGATYGRFAEATHRPWPSTRDVTCDEANSALGEPSRRIIALNLESSCEFRAYPTKVISHPFRRIDLQKLRMITDSANARLFVPITGPVRP